MTKPEGQQNEAVLPANKNEAVMKLIDLSNHLTALIEDETNKVAMSDAMGFIASEDEKTRAANRYQKAVEEFKARIDEFKGLDKSLLDRLESAQKRLGDSTRANVKILDKYRKTVEKQEG